MALGLLVHRRIGEATDVAPGIAPVIHDRGQHIDDLECIKPEACYGEPVPDLGEHLRHGHGIHFEHDVLERWSLVDSPEGARFLPRHRHALGALLTAPPGPRLAPIMPRPGI